MMHLRVLGVRAHLGGVVRDVLCGRQNRPVDQLALSPFAAGDEVTWWSDRGWRTGRFVGVITRGRHRGTAQVALGGRIAAERIVRVPVESLSRESAGRPDPPAGPGSE